MLHFTRNSTRSWYGRVSFLHTNIRKMSSSHLQRNVGKAHSIMDLRDEITCHWVYHTSHHYFIIIMKITHEMLWHVIRSINFDEHQFPNFITNGIFRESGSIYFPSLLSTRWQDSYHISVLKVLIPLILIDVFSY